MGISKKKRPLKEVKYITVTSENVLYDYRLEPLDMIIYGEICVLSNKLGHCLASNPHFAKSRNKSVDIIKRSISRLVKFGYIKLFGGKNKHRKIKILAPPKNI